MSKDRARPFSRKHRRYWIPVTGGMLLIGAINLALGFCAYDPPPPSTQQLPLSLPPPTAPPRPPGAIGLGDIPVAVMRTFAVTFPRNAPTAARKLVAADGTVTFELSFGVGSAARRATFREDGTLVAP